MHEGHKYNMTWFNKLKYIFTRDDFSKIKKVDIVLIRSDANCYLMPNSQFYYSPHINILTRELKNRGYSYLVITKPFGYINRLLATDKAINISSTYARYAIFKKLLPSIRTIFWKKIIKKSNAKYIICIMPPKDLCNAAHKLDVWLADLQHGVIAQSHPYYGKAYNLHKKAIDLPKHFLLWDENSDQVISKWKDKKNIKTSVLGNLALLEPVLYLENDILENKELQNIILISLQWGLDSISNSTQIFHHDLISKELVKVIKLNSNHNWLIRLHPVQQKNEQRIYDLLSKILPEEIINRSKQYASLKLLNVLMQTKLHISYSSSVTIEAAKFGISTILLDSRLKDNASLKDYFVEEKSKGIAIVVDNNQDAIKVNIEKILRIDDKKNKFDFSEDKRLFIENMEKLFPYKSIEKNKTKITHKTSIYSNCDI